ncbi:hypothetical protein FHS31_000357 [Sphingomonas vulcanisoli]|uniref:TonB-dependent receptor n=1 Tax=Sphingomonas vulcanisoli TaxID=1658060 RepID=A0ABX0TSK4_9SPHN|nr:TonB-dependent receptor [Sphingomonas vulcanisoli]NIJ06775.1 hypothetical protein [Sphingomonas vulcanisoli]
MTFRFILLLAASLPTLVLAQATPTKPAAKAAKAAADMAADADDEIVVRGQKPPGSVIGDIPPEQTLNPADIRAYGVNSVSDLLDELAPQTTSVRGRGGEAPAVLLNGKRISSFAEIRDVPTEAILRAEILPEEVALKYGFSADQKVVNIVLRRRFRSMTGAVNGGTTTEGGGTGGDANADLFRIQGDNRVNIDGRYNQTDRLLESQRGLTSMSPDGIDLSPYRTLSPTTRTETLNTVYARALGGVSATVNATITGSQSNALQGLPSASLVVPAGDPFLPAGGTVDRTFGTDALGQRVRSLTEHLGIGANGNFSAKWRWNFTGNYDHGDSRTASETGYDSSAIQARLTARDPTLNPNGDLTGALGGLLTDRARSVTNTANTQMVSNGKLFHLPAGDASSTIKIGGTLTAIDSSSHRANLDQTVSLSRKAGNFQLNVDLPIASKANDVLPFLGKLTANANIAVNQLSDLGTLTTWGGGINWSPIANLTFIGSYTNDQGAPTVAQLGNPLLVTAQTRVFDAQKGVTADVISISGGNRNLTNDDRTVIRLGVQFKPLAKSDLNVTINYVKSRIRDAIATLPEPTAAIEGAFPERFVRDADGDLTSVDSRPVNFDREDTQSLRSGFTFSIPLKPSPAVVAAFRKAMQARFGGAFPRPPGGGDAPPPPPPDGGPPPPSPGDGPPPGGPPPGGGGFGGPGGGFGGPPGGGPGGGFGPGGGGFGGFGRGGGGGAQRFRQNAGGRIQIALYHTWTIQDRVLIRPGVPVIDLLHGGSITSGGGQAAHQVQAQLGYSNNGIGARLEGNWQSGTTVDAAPGSSTGDLHFSSLATLNLRSFFNIGEMPRFIGKDWARNLRVTFSLTNLFDTRQHIRDAFGDTPIRYQSAYLDPAGRTFRIGIRKLFTQLPPRPFQRPAGG